PGSSVRPSATTWNCAAQSRGRTDVLGPRHGRLPVAAGGAGARAEPERAPAAAVDRVGPRRRDPTGARRTLSRRPPGWAVRGDGTRALSALIRTVQDPRKERG